MSARRHVAAILFFAAAMAWVEAAVVAYLRWWSGRVEPYQPNPLPVLGPIGGTEIVRELATLGMLAAVAWLAGRTLRARLGYFLIAFGAWDLSYYLFLRLITGWPTNLLAWDVLFLLPLPWWGPVLAPSMIALVMMVFGLLLLHPGNERLRPAIHPGAWTLGACGALLALLVFIHPALQALPHGTASMLQTLPERFPWVPFALAFVLLATPAAWHAVLLRRTLRVNAGERPEDATRPSSGGTW